MNKTIHEFITDIAQSHHLVGVAVSVVQNDELVTEFGIGYRNLLTREPVSPTSLFHLASVSKLFTATAVMQLVERKKLSLDERINDIVPELKTEKPMGNQITLRHLLSHASGFPDIIDYKWDAPEYDDKALERYIRNQDVHLLFPPGESFSYSNLAYEVLGYIVEKSSGCLFEDYVKSNVLNPLDMTESTHFKSKVPSHLAVAPHVNDLETHISDIYPYNRPHAPSSTLHSNAQEMSHWALANLNQGQLFSKVVLGQDTYLSLWEPQIPVGIPDRPDKFAGLGWFLDKRRGYQFVYHSGQDIGFTSYLLLVPEQSLGITILCNTEPAPIEEMAFGVMDLVLGLAPDPIKPSIMQPLGPVYLQSGIEGMKSAYLSLQKEKPNDFNFGIAGFLKVSASLLDQNKNKYASDILSFVISVFPNDAAGYEMMARACFQERDYPEALAFAQKSLEIDPNNDFLRRQIKPLLSGMS